MADTQQTPESLLTRLRWPLFLTRAGLLAERVWQAFWPSGFYKVMTTMQGII